MMTDLVAGLTEVAVKPAEPKVPAKRTKTSKKSQQSSKIGETKVRQSHNGKNKRYSLKVLPLAAKVDLVNWNDGIVDVATEIEADNVLKAFLDANGGVKELIKKGIKVSLYHYRMPTRVVGASDPVTSKDYRNGSSASSTSSELVITDDEAATLASEVKGDELERIADEIKAAREAGDEALVNELIALAQSIATSA